MKDKKHKRIDTFQPISSVLHNNIDVNFSAGEKYESSFNSFLNNDVKDYYDNGDGITYLITNNEDIVSYFVVSSYAIPYHYIIDNDDKIWSIPAIELKMFAVSEKYQDTFFKYIDSDMPISAWCLLYIINFVTNTIGCKAIFLHTVAEAENFYRINGFQSLNELMPTIHSIDDELASLWLPLQKIDFGDGYCDEI